jgi:hypothetical protein
MTPAKMTQWLLPVALVLALAGYFGSWVAHPAAGLVITGLDLGEYVKFLPEFRQGSLLIWRAGFYAPLVAVSAAALLAAFRPSFAYNWWIRGVMIAIALVAAFNLVPPAWTPARLLEPEFRLQTTCLFLLLAGVAFSPFLALLPRVVAMGAVTTLCVVAIVAPIHGFLQMLPAVESLYNHPLSPAWGLWLMALGLLLIGFCYWRQPAGKETP